MANIDSNRFPNDVHRMTGPSAYTEAINDCLAADPAVRHRQVGTDYEGFFRYKAPLSGLLYIKRGSWREQQTERGVLRPEASSADGS